jgi:hypothetical protein
MHRRYTSDYSGFTSYYKNGQSDCFKHLGARARTQSEILTSTENSTSLACRVYLNRYSWWRGRVLQLLLILVLLRVLLRLFLPRRLLRLLRFALVTVNCTSTSPTSRNTTCTTSFPTLSVVKPCVLSYRSYKKVNFAACLLHKCQIVIHWVPVNFINWSPFYLQVLSIKRLTEASIHIVRIYAIPWSILRPLRLHAQYFLR